jgi:L-ascorbate metabolism protein UlaG (beta-lactamase superfamily)
MMKITRYFQSCLLIEEADTRILIDPSGQEAENSEKFGKLDAVLYTHEHGDHFEPSLAKKFAESGVPIYANTSTAKQIEVQKIEIKNGDEFEVKSLKIKALELPHCLMWDGAQGPQNTGYLINGKFFHPGDGVELSGLSVDVLAVPINGPDVSWKDAFALSKQLAAKDVIPVHYDYLGGNADVFANMASSNFGLNAHALKNGESVEI